MRIYIVQPGDSPAGIASQEDHASCPKCAIDLIRANPHKETVVHPNGFVSFKELRVGEELCLPEKWFDGRLELLPPAYFASLPYHNGVTPSPFGEAAAGVLRDFRALDVAADKLAALTAMGDQAFTRSAGDVAAAIDAAVQPALAGSIASAAQHAQAALETLRYVSGERIDIQNALASALEHAQQAIHDLYATMQPPGHS
jgi:hypothetical protein